MRMLQKSSRNPGHQTCPLHGVAFLYRRLIRINGLHRCRLVNSHTQTPLLYQQGVFLFGVSFWARHSHRRSELSSPIRTLRESPTSPYSSILWKKPNMPFFARWEQVSLLMSRIERSAGRGSRLSATLLRPSVLKTKSTWSFPLKSWARRA